MLRPCDGREVRLDHVVRKTEVGGPLGVRLIPSQVGQGDRAVKEVDRWPAAVEQEAANGPIYVLECRIAGAPDRDQLLSGAAPEATEITEQDPEEITQRMSRDAPVGQDRADEAMPTLLLVEIGESLEVERPQCVEEAVPQHALV